MSDSEIKQEIEDALKVEHVDSFCELDIEIIKHEVQEMDEVWDDESTGAVSVKSEISLTFSATEIHHTDRDQELGYVPNPFLRAETLRASRNSALVSNNGTNRSRGNSIECDQRGKLFDVRRYMEAHRKTHTVEHPYVCEVCQKKFACKSYLLKHAKYHAADRPYACDVCPKKFVFSDALKRHSNVHTRAESFPCDVCHKAFSRKSTLLNHVKVHSDEKPYACSVCQKAYKQKGSLKYHFKTHSGFGNI